MSNNFTYCICPKAEFDARAAKGFTGGNRSDDGEFMIGDLGDQTMHMFDASGIPQWIQDVLDADAGHMGCCMSHGAALTIVNDERWRKREELH